MCIDRVYTGKVQSRERPATVVGLSGNPWVTQIVLFHPGLVVREGVDDVSID